MPSAPVDRRYAHDYETSVPGGQQTGYPKTYQQYGYFAGIPQPGYTASTAPVSSGGYPHPGSYLHPESTVPAPRGNQGYMNGTYQSGSETHFGRHPFPAPVHSSGQMSDQPGPHRSGNYAGPHGHSQQFEANRNTSYQSEPADSTPTRQPRNSEQPADFTGHKLKNSANSGIVNHGQQNSPHIAKPAVLHPDATSKFLYLLSL